MFFFEEIINNKPLWVAVLTFSIAQLIKLVVSLFRSKKFDYGKLLASGGMPSSHAALVTSMSVSVGKMIGFDSPIFAACAVLSFIVMYDAAGVRRSAGEQAVLLNILMEKIEEAGIKMDERLKEFLGHRPIEVCVGAVLGIIVGLII